MIETPYVIAILTGGGGAIATLFALLRASWDKQLTDKERQIIDKDKQLEEQKSINKTLYGIADEAVKSAIDTTNFYRAKDGKPPVLVVAPVVPEGSSPPSMMQRDAALIATMRANMAAVKIAASQEPRREPSGHHDE